MDSILLDDFLDLFKEQFSLSIRKSIVKESIYSEIEEWSSMQSLIVFTTINESYNISFTQKEYAITKTVEELFFLVQSKIEGR
ncbi:MAG: hypothetical protein HRT73_14750 [Flavobacteriales bacterium]|nr:hypothetical protein [Flavobacteriales bacterium]